MQINLHIEDSSRVVFHEALNRYSKVFYTFFPLSAW